MTAQARITGIIARQSDASLRDMARRLQHDHRDGAEVVLSAVLDALMARLSESAFVAFCAELEAA